MNCNNVKIVIDSLFLVLTQYPNLYNWYLTKVPFIRDKSSNNVSYISYEWFIPTFHANDILDRDITDLPVYLITNVSFGSIEARNQDHSNINDELNSL